MARNSSAWERGNKMKVNSGSFIKEGVFLYTEAQNTLSAFEKEIGRLLATVLGRRKRWDPLRKHQIVRADLYHGWRGWSVSAGITGGSRYGEAEIECGFWWKDRKSVV